MSSPHDTDESRFLELLARNRRRISAIARAFGRGEPDDLLQQILLQIWRSLPQLRDPATSETWCYRVALNTALSWARSDDRRRIRPESVDTDQVAGTIDGHDLFRLLQQFLQTLNETDRAVVLMYLDDLTTGQMAEVLGLTEGAVRVRLHRIKQKLSGWSAIDS